MRVVKLVWNQKVNADANFSVQTEIVVDDGVDPEQSGRDALNFLEAFVQGLAQKAEDNL